MEARVELDSGSGRVSLDDRFFVRVTGDEDDGVWETPGYDADGGQHGSHRD
jgi:hypothetical protein